MVDIKIVPKGWGFERWIVNKEEYCGKELFFIKGRRCSVHFHKLKDETFYVAEGELAVEYIEPKDWNYIEGTKPEEYAKMWRHAVHNPTLADGKGKKKEICLVAGNAFYVPPMMIHQMYGWTDTRMFEFSTQHFDSDSYRIIKGN